MHNNAIQKLTNNLNFLRLGTLIVAASLLLAGCSTMGSIGESFDRMKSGDDKHLDNIDPYQNLSRDDYRHMSAPKSDGEPKLQIDKSAPPIPKLAEILAAPRPPKIGETQIVSISVTDDVPLKDALLELAKLADIDIELDANITGGINFVAKDKPFNEVIDRIANLAGLRYTMKGGVLRVEMDTPYIQSYPVDFLNVDRDSDSSVMVDTNLAAGKGGAPTAGGGSSGSSSSSSTNGSTSSIKTKSAGDFWKSMEIGVQQILGYQESPLVSETTSQAQMLASSVNTPENGAVAGAAAAAPVAPKASAAPAPAGAPVAATATGSGPKYTLNKQAGVLTVDATAKQHDLIKLFLTELRKTASAQVLIEAKIIEVDLNDQYASGINWSAISVGAGIGTITTSAAIGTPGSLAGSTFNDLQDAFSLTTSNNPNNILNMLEQFGTARTLSSPRLHAVNNQLSTLTFTTNHVYFTIQVTPGTVTPGTAGGAATVTPPAFTSTVNTVPLGILMSIMPSVDLDNNEVTLSVRPTLTTFIKDVTDPAFDLEALLTATGATASVTDPKIISAILATHNEVPEIEVRELDSTVKLKSGQTMVIGGLMQQESQNMDTGVPFVSGIPVVGNIFKSVAKSAHNKELVLLIKATIVDTRGSLSNTDKNIFHKFSDDPRPVSF